MKEGRNSNSGHGEALSNEEVRIGNHGARKIWPEKKVSDVGWGINIRQRKEKPGKADIMTHLKTAKGHMTTGE